MSKEEPEISASPLCHGGHHRWSKVTRSFINASGKSEKKNARPHAGSEEAEDRIGPQIRDAPRADALVFVTLCHLAESLFAESQCQLFEFGVARTQKADLWRGADDPSSHPEHEDEPLSRDISSHLCSCQICVNFQRQKAGVSDSSDYYIFSIWCREQTHFTSF